MRDRPDHVIDILTIGIIERMEELLREHLFSRGDAMSACMHALVGIGLSEHTDNTEALRAQVIDGLNTCIRQHRGETVQ